MKRVKLMVAMMLSLIALGANARTEVVDGVEWRYRVVNNTAELYNDSGEGAIPLSTKGSVSIPGKLGEYLVTSIGNRAFKGCRSITSISIPSSVTSISTHNAFCGCSSLKSFIVPEDHPSFASVDGLLLSKDKTELIYGVNGDVNIPEGVTEIASSAFSELAGLTSVSIPSSVLTIGTSAFCACAGMKSYIVANNNPSFASVDGLLLSKDKTELIYGVNGDVNIPEGVTSWAQYAFYGLSGMTSLAIPMSLKSVYPRSSGFFRGCSSLKSFIVPEDHPSFASVDGLLLSKDKTELIYGVNGDVNIPEGVTSIDWSAFEGLDGLTGVTMPSSVTKIGDLAFSKCSHLMSVTIPSSVTGVGDESFFGCSPRDVTVPGWRCGINFWLVTNLVISSGTTSIRSNAFQNSSCLLDVTIPSSVTNIGEKAFTGCGMLGDGVVVADGCVLTVNGSCPSSVSLEDDVRLIADGAFSGCTGVTDVAVSDSVLNIGSFAFRGCSNLEKIVLGTAVTELPENALSIKESETGETSLTTIVIKGGWIAGPEEGCITDRSPGVTVYVSQQWNLPATWEGYEVKYLPPEKPVITPADGTILSDSLAVAITTDDADAQLYYTLDGSIPTTNSIPYKKFRIFGKTTVKAIASYGGTVDSDVVEANYAFGYCTAPSIVPIDGTVIDHSNQEVSIDWNESDGTLYYTLDGSEPTTNSTAFTQPFKISETTTIKAKVFSEKFFDSAVVSSTVTRNWIQTAHPTITADATFMGSKTKVSIECDDGVVVYYTVDGSNPTRESLRYDEPFYVTQSCTVKAFAVKDDCLDSTTESFSIEKVWGVGDTLLVPDVKFSDGGQAAWSKDESTFKRGSASMRSGKIADNETSELSATVKGVGTIRFNWKTSCEDSGGYYDWDHLEFHADDTVYYLDGETDWSEISHEFKGFGTHTLRWVYVKDNAGADGQDCAWIDGIVLDFDAIPDLGDCATSEDVRDALEGSADTRIPENITDAATYKSYQLWAERVAVGGVTKQQIKDSSNAWLSYALDTALIEERPQQGDVAVAALSLNDSGVTLKVSVDGITVGNNATEANLNKVFEVVAAANVSDEFTKDAVVVESVGAEAGNASFMVKPKDETASSFFIKVKMNP